jgi:hypothetical protein
MGKQQKNKNIIKCLLKTTLKKYLKQRSVCAELFAFLQFQSVVIVSEVRVLR